MRQSVSISTASPTVTRRPLGLRRRLLIGLLVAAEVRRGGIDLGEKAAVRAVFRRLVTPGSKTQLTEEGMRCMNAYASGGYDFLAESRDVAPASPEEFVRDFVGLIEEAADGESQV